MFLFPSSWKTRCNRSDDETCREGTRDEMRRAYKLFFSLSLFLPCIDALLFLPRRLSLSVSFTVKVEKEKEKKKSKTFAFIILTFFTLRAQWLIKEFSSHFLPFCWFKSTSLNVRPTLFCSILIPDFWICLVSSDSDVSACSPMKCPTGCDTVIRDVNGCPTCQCRPAQCSRVMCRMYCVHGFKRDAKGCEICACNDSPQPCPPLACEQTCQKYRKDYSGKNEEDDHSRRYDVSIHAFRLSDLWLRLSGDRLCTNIELHQWFENWIRWLSDMFMQWGSREKTWRQFVPEDPLPHVLHVWISTQWTRMWNVRMWLVTHCWKYSMQRGNDDQLLSIWLKWSEIISMHV